VRGENEFEKFIQQSRKRRLIWSGTTSRELNFASLSLYRLHTEINLAMGYCHSKSYFHWFTVAIVQGNLARLLSERLNDRSKSTAQAAKALLGRSPQQSACRQSLSHK